MSELKQVLQSGRERDAFGILWDVRHWEQDLQIALAEASPSAPVSVAYLDMNGLKGLNDSISHEAGDNGLRAYFRAVAAVLGDTRGQAYRLGGDEVLVMLPSQDPTSALRTIERACRLLMTERIQESPAPLSIAAGVVSVTTSESTPRHVRLAADKEQQRAKERSRFDPPPPPSVIASEGREALRFLRLTAEGKIAVHLEPEHRQ